MQYATNVFINCPFEPSYRKFLDRLIFIFTFYGFTVLISKNRSSAHDRLVEISKMINDSKFSIHDLSKNRAAKRGELARFNMPFEFGIDFGCFLYKKRRKDKVIAVMDAFDHDYDQFLSDLSGRDILFHGNEPDLLFTIIPQWLMQTTDKLYDSPKALRAYYSAWIKDYKKTLRQRKYDLRKLKSIDIHMYQIILKAWMPDWKIANDYSDPST